MLQNVNNMSDQQRSGLPTMFMSEGGIGTKRRRVEMFQTQAVLALFSHSLGQPVDESRLVHSHHHVEHQDGFHHIQIPLS